MRHRMPLLLAAFLLTGCGKQAVPVEDPGPVLSGPSFGITLKCRPTEGKSAHVTVVDDSHTSRRVTDEAGKVILKEDDHQVRREEYVETVEEGGGEALPAKFRRRYSKATVLSNEQPPRAREHEGRTLNFVITDEDYVVME
ncbi:MAG: hypothetical protein AB7K24_00945 [Gemmataceae bacterium]